MPPPSSKSVPPEGTPIGGLPTPQNNSLQIRQQQAELLENRQQISARLSQVRSQAEARIASIDSFKARVRPPTKTKYYILGTFTLILDIATIVEDAFGADITVIIYFIKIIIKALAFVGYYYVIHKDSKYAQELQSLAGDVSEQISHIQQRTQNIRQRAKEKRTAALQKNQAQKGTSNQVSGAGKTQGARVSNVVNKIGSLVTDPKGTIFYWLIDAIPYADLFPWETYAVFKLYRMTHKNYKNVIKFIEAEYATTVVQYTQAVQELNQEIM